MVINVNNSPDEVVTAISGDTVEVVHTDAEVSVFEIFVIWFANVILFHLITITVNDSL